MAADTGQGLHGNAQTFPVSHPRIASQSLTTGVFLR